MEWLEYCKSFIPKIMIFYKRHHKHFFDIENPKTFTEKIQWLKIYDSTELKTNCADKILVRNYVKEKLGKDICIPLLGVFNNFNDINFNILPNSFVIKCNHGCGMNIIIKDKNKLNKNEIKQKLNNWLKYDYSELGGELQYKNIKRKIFIEEYKENLEDIKIFCFNGIPKFIQVDKHFYEHRMNFYDTEWKPLYWLSNKDFPANYKILDPKPECLTNLLNIAKKLSTDFKFVRVDLYPLKTGIFLGELTFTPGSGTQTYLNEGDLKIGEMLDL